MKTKVLVVGGGGREHALAWKLRQSRHVEQVIWAPGSDAVVGYERWALAPWAEMAERAAAANVDLVVIGPDQALADGAADIFREHGLKVFGPSRLAAELEWSKRFAKDVMHAAGISTARAQTLDRAAWMAQTEPQQEAWARQHWPRGGVAKADGLALGKGVILADDAIALADAVTRLFQISSHVLVEERVGVDAERSPREVSYFAICDGTVGRTVASAQDYKRLGAGQTGPNTGGMGAMSPPPAWTAAHEARIQQEVVDPILREMRLRGRPFVGILFVGLMVEGGALKSSHKGSESWKYWVLEFNARWGDPEAQAILPRWNDDAFEWFLAAAQGDLGQWTTAAVDSSICSVYAVGAAPGYPEAPQKNLRFVDDVDFPVDLRNPPDGFVSAVGLRDHAWITQGGRVLGGLGLAPRAHEARQRAFENLRRRPFGGMVVREDVGC